MRCDPREAHRRRHAPPAPRLQLAGLHAGLLQSLSPSDARLPALPVLARVQRVAAGAETGAAAGVVPTMRGEDDGVKPIVIDLCCLGRRMVKSRHYEHKSRQSAMGERSVSAQKTWVASAAAWRQPQKTRAYEVTRTPLVVVHDDAMPVEQPGSRRLQTLPRQRHYGLRSMVGVCKLSDRHGQQANCPPYAGSHRRGRQL